MSVDRALSTLISGALGTVVVGVIQASWSLVVLACSMWAFTKMLEVVASIFLERPIKVRGAYGVCDTGSTLSQEVGARGLMLGYVGVFDNDSTEITSVPDVRQPRRLWDRGCCHDYGQWLNGVLATSLELGHDPFVVGDIRDLRRTGF